MDEQQRLAEDAKRVNYTVYQAKISPKKKANPKYVKDASKMLFTSSGAWGVAQDKAIALANEANSVVIIEAWNILFLFSGKKMQKANTLTFTVVPDTWPRTDLPGGGVMWLDRSAATTLATVPA